MKLNHDCMRDCLLYLESKIEVCINEVEDEDELEFSSDISLEGISLKTMFIDLKNWTNQDIFYSVFNLHQGGYLNTSIDDSKTGNNFSNVCVYYITLKGHEFLDSIRDNERWRNIKGGLNAVRNYSLSAMSAVAEGLTAGAINAYLAQRGGISAL